jgi:hypothetical protein
MGIESARAHKTQQGHVNEFLSQSPAVQSTPRIDNVVPFTRAPIRPLAEMIAEAESKAEAETNPEVRDQHLNAARIMRELQKADQDAGRA